MNPEISVIIPVYNRQDTISISLNSLINQSYNNFEVIIIDDGSYDSTSRVIEKYLESDIRFKYIYQDNSGVAIARNKGLELATGNYVCFLDSDDYYESKFLEKMYEKIKENHENEVCYCGYNIVSVSKKSKRKTQFKSGDILIDYILEKVNIHTTGWLIKRELLLKNNINFPEGVSWGEDFEFFCHVLSITNKVVFVPDYLTNYTVDFTDSSRLSSFSINKIDKDYESIQRLLNNRQIAKNQNIRSALLEYRLSALITYRLINAYKYDINKKVIYDYFNKYKKFIVKFTFNNGLRSIKLNINKIKLLYFLKKLGSI